MKLCACGCGIEVTRTWVNGHHRRKSTVDYVVEDRGYTTPCWIWQHSLQVKGYGQRRYNGAVRLAHQVAYEQAYGVIPDGKEVDHLCRQRSCVNPQHLEAVPHVVNLRRARRTRLNETNADAIRKAVASGESRKALAHRYGIAEQTIAAVVHYRSWKIRAEE